MRTNRPRFVPLILLLVAVASGWSELPARVQSSAMILNEAVAEKDARLNVVYKKLMASIPTAVQREHLKVAQRAWLVWLDKEEAMVNELRGPKYGLSTRLDLMDARIKQFEDLQRESADFYGSRGR